MFLTNGEDVAAVRRRFPAYVVTEKDGVIAVALTAELNLWFARLDQHWKCWSKHAVGGGVDIDAAFGDWNIAMCDNIASLARQHEVAKWVLSCALIADEGCGDDSVY